MQSRIFFSDKVARHLVCGYFRIPGNPAAVLSWHFKTANGTQGVTEAPEKYEITTATLEPLYGKKELHFILKILNVTDADFGNYTCKAVNRFGNGDDEITVFGEYEF
jgi:hypothetical protein